MPDVPRKPSTPRLEVDPRYSVSPMVEGDRELILRKLREQTDELGGKIDDLAKATGSQFEVIDRRVLDLEKAQLEEKQTRVAVQQLIGKVDVVIERERRQDVDIGALQAQLRPVVQAEASSEGMLAGAAAGHRAGKKTSIIGAVIGIALVTVLNYCQEQIRRGVFSEPASSSEKK